MTSTNNGKIGIDHLAFTCKLSSFQNLEHANTRRFTKLKWVSFPKRSYVGVADPLLKESLISDYRAEYVNVLHLRLEQFFNRVLGLRLSNKRGVGFHGYKDSYKIMSKSAPIELGFVGFGGNNDTVYIQLSGQGCSHVFSRITPLGLHFWLADVLDVYKLTRADLFYDDFDGNFGTSYAETAYEDGAFNNPNGGRTPKIDIRRPRVGSVIQGDTVYIGSRKSNVFWRIYDKSLEQGVENQTWFRNEVELKAVNVDVLLNVAEAFAGVCPFAASINLEHGYTYKSLTKKSVVEFQGRLKWARQQVGSTLSDILDAFDGDIEKAFCAVVNTKKSKWQLTDSCKQMLFNLEKLEV